MLLARPKAAVGGQATTAGDHATGRLLRGAVAMALRAVRAADSGSASGSAPALIRGKVRCEAAMLLRSLWPLRSEVAGLSRALDLLAADLTAPEPAELAVWLCLHPGVELDLALVPIHLRCLGIGDPRLDSFLAALFRDGRLSGPERTPHRQLEQLWLQGLWRGLPEQPRITRVLESSALAWEFDQLTSSTDDAYAFTHAVLYASDHGRRLVALPRPAEQISTDAEAILAVALDAGNHDVAAEVLWTWPMLGLGRPPLVREAGSFLAKEAVRHGFLPGPGYDPLLAASLPPDQQDAYEVQTSYHTTLVHAMTIAASRDEAPVADPAAPDQTVEAPGPVPPVEHSRPWWDYFSGLSPSRREALSSAVLTIGIRRAAAAADLVGLAALVADAEKDKVPPGPALRQAKRLLALSLLCGELATG